MSVVSVVKEKEKERETVANFLTKPVISNFLEEQLGLKKKEFVQNLIAIAESDNSLKDCKPADLMKCAMNATALDLPLNKNMGAAYVIACKQKQPDNTWVTKPQFQIGWKGFYQLAIRTEKYETLTSLPVREGEIKINKFTDEFEVVGDFPDKPIVGYLAFFKLKSGFKKFLYMTVQELEAHAQKYSKSYNTSSSVWRSNFDTMSMKTVLKLLLSKYGDFSPEVSLAIEKDQTDSEGNYIDNAQTSRRLVNSEVIEQRDSVGVKMEVVEVEEVDLSKL